MPMKMLAISLFWVLNKEKVLSRAVYNNLAGAEFIIDVLHFWLRAVIVV